MANENNRAARRQAAKQKRQTHGNTVTNDLAAALEHHRAGRLERAEVLYRQVLQREPRNSDALHLLGAIALTQGQPEQAIVLISKAIAIQPNLAIAHSNLGNALRATGKLTQAVESYKRAIDAQPNLADAHNNLGSVLCEQGDFTSALLSCQKAIQLAPALAEAHNNLGNALQGIGRGNEAEAEFRRAIALKPDYAEAYNNLGNLLKELNRLEEAVVCHRRAIALKPDFATAYYSLGTTLRVCGDMQAALENYQQTVSLAPNLAAAWNDLGTAYRALGQFEQAIASLRRAIALEPNFAEAYRHLAGCQRMVADDNYIASVTALIKNPDLSVEDRIAAEFALAKSLDDADRFDEAFSHYAEANLLFRQARAAEGQRFDPDALQQQVDYAIETFTPEFFAATTGWGNSSKLPVFIVGMPRSSTSLVEQIVATHSQVFGAGELREIGQISAKLTLPWEATAVRQFADIHLNRLQTLGSGAEQVVDKMPDNIFQLGLIAALFPAAHVIICHRDARDTCLSCYFQKFATGNLFSYDLADCGKRYLETQRLVEHWQQVLPLAMLDLHYEALVADLESESRRLIAFLGLEWEPACLDFHRTQRAVSTASSWQVRQPLFQRSLDRWQNYRQHLAPLLDVLSV